MSTQTTINPAKEIGRLNIRIREYEQRADYWWGETCKLRDTEKELRKEIESLKAQLAKALS